MKLQFNHFGEVERPEVYLCQPDKTVLGSLNVSSLSGDFKFNSYSEISFSVPRYYQDALSGEQKVSPLFDKVEGLRLVYLRGIGYFQIQEPELIVDGLKEYKECTAYSSEYELTQKYLDTFIINQASDNIGETENAVAGSINNVNFYDLNDTAHSLLHLCLEKLPTWEIGHVDESLKTLQRQFDVDRQSVYDFLMNDAANTFHCVFYFDTIQNKINVYAEDAAGEDTDVYISRENLIKSLHASYSADDIKTVLSVYGADDLSIRKKNLGMAYLMDLSYYHTVDFMGQDLYDAYAEYKSLIERKSTEYESLLQTYSSLNADLNTLWNKRPEDETSTTWSEYGLYALQEKYASYKNIQEVQAESGWGNPSNENYESLYLPNYNLMVEVEAEINLRKNGIANIKDQISANMASMNAIAAEVSMNNSKNFTDGQLKRLSAFIREDEYSDSCFAVYDYMTENAKDEIIEELKSAGKKELAKLSHPQITFDADMANIFALPEFSKIVDKFDTGNYIRVEIREGYVVKVRLLEYHINFFDMTDFDASFGTMLKLEDQGDIHADLLAQAIEAGKSVASNSSFWQKGADTATATEQKIREGLIDALTSIKSNNIAGQAIEWDQWGIHLRKIVDDVLDPHEGWITNNRILFSDDNFETVRQVLGYFKVNDVEQYGVICDAIISGYIEACEMVGGSIRSNNYSETEFTGSKIDLENGELDLAGHNITYNEEDGLVISGNVNIGASSTGPWNDIQPYTHIRYSDDGNSFSKTKNLINLFHSGDINDTNGNPTESTNSVYSDMIPVWDNSEYTLQFIGRSLSNYSYEQDGVTYYVYVRYSETTDITDSNFANMMKESPSASSNFVWTCVSTNETPPTTIGSYSCEQYKHPVDISKIYFYHENTENGQYTYLGQKGFAPSDLSQTKSFYTFGFSNITFTQPVTHIRFVANQALTGDSISVENISQHEIQVELGSTPTDYEPYYEDGFRVSNWVGTYIDNKQEDSSIFGDYLWSLSAKYVSNNVSEDMSGLESRISSNEDYLLGSDRNGGLVSQSKNISTFFEFDTSENGYLKIGKKAEEQTEDPFYLKMKNNRISFYGSDNQNVVEDTPEDGEVAFISSKKMYITEVEVLSSIEVGTNVTDENDVVPVLRIGNYEVAPRASGNLSIRLFKRAGVG